MTTSNAQRIFGLGLAVLALAPAFTLRASVEQARASQQTAPTPATDPTSVPADAVTSADGKRAAFTADEGRQIWTATRTSASAAWTTPVRLLTIRGAVKKLVFSPDGTRLAFENPRSGMTARGAPTGFVAPGDPRNETWGFIAVSDLATRRIAYVDPVFAADTEPVWSADGRQITFTRTIGQQAGTRITKPAPDFRAWTAPGTAPGEKFSLVAALATPYVYEPSASADGKAVAYASREGATRNVYYWRVGGAAQLVANFPNDDGMELTQLALARTGNAVAFVRGAATNPASLPDPPQPEIWIVGAKSDTARKIGTGTAPRFSSEDSQLTWSSGQTTMVASLKWDRERLVSVSTPAAAGVSPPVDGNVSLDGKRILYRRQAGLEIVDVATKKAWPVPNSTGTDGPQLWSLDSRYVAYRKAAGGLRGNGGIGGYRNNGAPVAAQPWSLWIADAQTSESRQVFQAKEGIGSVPGGSLYWSDDNRLAFQSEADGWQHYYSVPAAGGDVTLITRGDGDVEFSDVSNDHTHLIVTSNIGDLGRRHVTLFDFRGGTLAIVKPGTASQWAPVELADGGLAYIEAGSSTPPTVMMRAKDGTTTAAGLPRVAAGAPVTKFVEPLLVEYPALDGQTAYGQLMIPAQPNGCAVIFAHGGIRRQMLPGFHYLDIYSNLYEMNQYLVGRGCVVLSVEYRSSVMRGYAFRNAPGWGYAGASEMLDVAGAAKYLLARADVDASRRIGVFGLSWGGYITSQALAQYPDLFSVGFDMAGVHTSPSQEGIQYSAIAFLDKWTRPLYLAQGDDDRNVNFSEGLKLAVALHTKRPNVEFVERVFPGETHDMYLTFEHLASLYNEGAQFLLKHLGVK